MDERGAVKAWLEEARRRMAQETTSRLESRRRAVIAAGEDAMLSIHTEAGRQ